MTVRHKHTPYKISALSLAVAAIIAQAAVSEAASERVSDPGSVGAGVGHQVTAQPTTFNLPAQSLATSLRAVGSVTNTNILFDPPQVKDLKAPAVKADATTEEVLRILLKDTGIPFEFLNDQTVVIGAESSKRLGNIRISQSDGSSNSVDEKKPESTEGVKLEEIVVTANRREQRAQDVPSTLQVFGGADLEKRGVEGFEDYLTTVPGLGLRTTGNGTSKITIRGVANVGGSDSGWKTTTTTGLYINDVAVQGTDVPPDLVLYDLNRVEVLKGPQGTLYGEGAMGGAIKMVLNSPNLSEFEGKSDLTVSSTEGGGINYGVRGAVNVPLVADRLALRISGTYRDDQGFVDNIAHQEPNHDDKRAYSIRGTLGAKLTDDFSAEVLALYNDLNMEDYPEIDIARGNRILSAEDRFNDVESTLLALTLKNNFEFAELTSVTANFNTNRKFVEPIAFGRFFFSEITAPVLTGGIPIFSGISFTSDPYHYDTDVKSFSQELRLVSNQEGRFHWIVGAFYRDKKQHAPNIGTVAAEDLPAVNAALAAADYPLLPADGRYFDAFVVQTYEQYALYGEGNLDLGHGFEFTAGLRWYDEKANTTVTTTGYSYASAYLTSGPLELPEIKERGVIPKFALSYKLSPRNLLYAQAAKGFRAGAGNANFAVVGDEGAESDSLWSYEVGSKNSFADGRMVFNAAAFFIDWKGMQSDAYLDNGFGVRIPVTDNAGDAENYGVEAELSLAPTDRLTVGAAFGYTHSELTSSLDGLQLVGSKIPGTPEWTATGYGQYHVPTTLGEAFAGFDVRYVGKRNQGLILVNDAGNITFDGAPLDSYTLGNIRMGVNREDGWGATLFIDNLWNKRAVVSRSEFNPGRRGVERPRTYGLLVSKNF